MLSMTTWLYVIKTLLKSDMKQTDIRNTIIGKCLYSQYKVRGVYQVDGQKVWDNIISKDSGCLEKMEELNIHDLFGVYGYYEEISYKHMRATYPKKRRRKGA